MDSMNENTKMENPLPVGFTPPETEETYERMRAREKEISEINKERENTPGATPKEVITGFMNQLTAKEHADETDSNIQPAANPTESGVIDGVSAVGEIDRTKFKKITADDIEEQQLNYARQESTAELRALLNDMDEVIADEDKKLEELEKPEVQDEIRQIAKDVGTSKYAVSARAEEEQGDPAIRTGELRLSDFSPDYYDEEDEEAQNEVPDITVEEPKAVDQRDELYQEINNLPSIGVYTPVESFPFAETVREKKATGYSNVVSIRAREEGDRAFLNAMSKFKKTNYRIVRVPLINSGFWVDVVGTGPQDLILLYQNVTRGIAGIDYELERMKATIKGVVSTTPNVPMETLRNKIHFADYSLLAYARLIATFRSISSLGTCPKCRGELKFKANPEDLLLNADKMTNRINAMREIQTADELSLLALDRKFDFENSGISITLGHPSYIETVAHLNSMKHYAEEGVLSNAERANFIQQSNFLSMVRTAILPNGMRAANIYQKYLVLTMLEPDEFAQLMECAEEMTDAVIVPEFGAKDVICPHCGEKVTLSISAVDDMVFYHSTVSQAERHMKKPASTNG